jgi:hypothetical protein
MPDGSFAREAKFRTVDRNSLDPVERLRRAYQKAERDLENGGIDRSAYERIRGLYPRPPESVASFFLLNYPGAVMKHPAPVQEQALRENAERWLAVMGDGNSPQCISARALIADWHAWDAECDAIFENEGGSAMVEEEERLATAYHKAATAMIEAKATSLVGVLAKLEFAAEYCDLEKENEENPALGHPRIILGLIRDLKEALGRN